MNPEPKQFRIGNQTAFSAPIILEPFEYALSKDFDAFEFFPDKKESGEGWDVHDISSLERLNIRKRAGESGIALSVHAPWQANPLQPGFIDTIRKDMDFALDIGALLLVIHLYNDQGIQEFLEAVAPLITISAHKGVQLAVENTTLTSPDDFNLFFKLLREREGLPIDHIGMCFDMGHANLCGSTHNDYLRFMDHLDPGVPIIHAHLHENFGDFDSHLPIFTGPSSHNATGIRGVLERFNARSFSGSMIFEQWPDPPALLLHAREKLRALLREIPEKKVKEVPFEPAGASHAVSEEAIITLIVNADKKARNWRKKLNAFLDIISREEFDPTPENMACLAIYIRFLGSGEVVCVEDGGHFRPSHHAKCALAIEKRLIELTTDANSFIVRNIYPWLPSYDTAFTRQEPLTRIRDIAHRNDIPKELKNEIKRTLQNKLHRSAGPEDLVTCEKILKRITAPDANYSPSFVEEFKVFHHELKDFFNAYSLEERLKAVIKKGAAADAGKITEFLALKKEKDDSAPHTAKTLALLTSLRKRFRFGHLDVPEAQAQLLRLTDIGLEEFAFVLLSRLIKSDDEQSGQGRDWDYLMNVLVLALQNIRMSDFDKEECECALEELKCIQKYFSPNDSMLRFKALVERCQRLSDGYSEKIPNLFQERAHQLGKHLGVSSSVLRYFSEGEIRSNIIFQLSKITSSILHLIRENGDLPKWDIIVPGRVSGRLVSAARLDELADTFPDDVILLLEKVEGDEAVPEGVKGMVLSHSLPHLSHLAIRARQDRIVFVVCEDRNRFRKMQLQKEKMVFLEATSDTVELKPCKKYFHEEEAPQIKRKIEIPKADLASSEKLLSLDKIFLSNGGAKAVGLRKLEELSLQRDADFKTLPGMVIPFSAMMEALAHDRSVEEEFRTALHGIDDRGHKDISHLLKTLRDITVRLTIPPGIFKKVKERFGREARLMVRSSSNCEDLEEFSGAGMHESVANIRPENVGEAIGRVWASLWTPRAALERFKAGIANSGVHMAVVVQEMISPALSFVMHTVHPEKQRDEILIELAVGMGEVLTSACSAGTPYRMTYHKQTGEVRMLTFANFSMTYLPGPESGLIEKRINYANVPLTADSEYRNKLGARLGAIGLFVERAMGRAQDIEGAISDDNVYLVQTRVQQ